MDLATVTLLLITFNEIQNIRRTLTKLDWALRIVVIDSGSTDGTLEALAKHPRIDVLHRPFDRFAYQCNSARRTSAPTRFCRSMPTTS